MKSMGILQNMVREKSGNFAVFAFECWRFFCLVVVISRSLCGLDTVENLILKQKRYAPRPLNHITHTPFLENLQAFSCICCKKKSHKYQFLAQGKKEFEKSGYFVFLIAGCPETVTYSSLDENFQKFKPAWLILLSVFTVIFLNMPG